MEQKIPNAIARSSDPNKIDIRPYSIATMLSNSVINKTMTPQQAVDIIDTLKTDENRLYPVELDSLRISMCNICAGKKSEGLLNQTEIEIENLKAQKLEILDEIRKKAANIAELQEIQQVLHRSKDLYLFDSKFF